MIYCVSEEGWSIVDVDEDYKETLIELKVGDKLYTDNSSVNLIYVQSDKGKQNWYWIILDKPKVYDGQTMFTHKSYHSTQTHSLGRRTTKDNLKAIVGRSVLTDITKSVDRDLKLKGLGI